VHKVDHSLPTSTTVKNEWSCNSASPPYVHDMNRENFTFTVTLSKNVLHLFTKTVTYFDTASTQHVRNSIILYWCH